MTSGGPVAETSAVPLASLRLPLVSLTFHSSIQASVGGGRWGWVLSGL